MNKYKKLVNNSVIFLIGNMGSKIISFLMVPLYTNALTTQEYGIADLIMTTVRLLVPILTLELGQAALRYVVEKKEEKDRIQITSNLMIHSMLVTGLVLLLIPLIIFIDFFGRFNFIFVVLILLYFYNNLLTSYVRGIGQVKAYAFNGILTTIITVVSNIILLVFFKFGITGYLFSMVISMLVSNIYLLMNSRYYPKIKDFYFDVDLQSILLKFSAPIVLNSIMWWLINSSTRYFILFFIGASGNGLYAVANKIPSIISIITSIFNQSWQLSSYEEYESEDKDKFYTNIFNLLVFASFLVGAILIAIIKPMFKLLIDSSYYEAWEVTPFLILAVIYSAFSAFLGTIYTASKETKGTFTSSVIGGFTSVLGNFVFIPLFGLIGAGISTLFCFIIMFLYRIRDTQKYTKIRLNIREFIFSNIIMFLMILILFISDNVFTIVIQIILLLIYILINHKLIQRLLHLVRYVIFRGRG